MTDSGIGRVSDETTPTIFTIVCFVALAFYNVAELNFIIFATFRKYSGLYFWSFLVSTWGICVYSIGFLLKDIRPSLPPTFYVTLIIVGWCSMVTGQSVVLYSRLHLVLRSPSQLRLVLYMIIFDGIICHVPIIVMVYGANSNNPAPFLIPYSIYEKVQVTIFFIQELIISSLYIFETLKIMRPEGNIRGRASRRTLTHLIYVNTIIVVLDITILGLEYSGLYDIQTVYKGLVYSVKLKLEFSILNRLVELTQRKFNSSDDHRSHERSVHLETFNEQRVNHVDQEAGYKAYVTTKGTGDDSAGGEGTQNDDSILVTTTRVAISSEGEAIKRGTTPRFGDWRDIETDLESLEAESGENGIAEVSRAKSSASSQVQLARVET